jgi:tetratricopeptide (TPR) repeat protein
MMLRKKTNLVLLFILVFAVIFLSAGCDKIKVKNLRANYYFTRANQEFSDGRYRNAIEEYERALEFNPELVQAYRFLGEAYKNMYKPAVETEENLERARKALEALKKAYEIEPDNKDVLYSLGDMYDKLRDFDEAEKLYLRIIEMEPTDLSNYYVVAEFYKRYAGSDTEGEEGGKTPQEKAEELYLRRNETDPNNEQGYAYTARFYEELLTVESMNKAYEFHKKRVDLNPENAEAWLSMGVNRWALAYRLQQALSRQERLEIAKQGEEALLKAKDLDPSYPEPYSWLSVIYKSVLANIDPDRANRYEQLADRYGERFREARKRQAEREKLEEELDIH